MTDEQNIVPPNQPDAVPPIAPPLPPAAQQPYGQQPGYYAQAPYVQPGYPGYAPPPPRGLSIASMVLGIVGLLGSFIYGIGLFPAIAAIITGFIARKRQPQGKGLWLTGLITGWVALAFCILWIVGIIVFFTVMFSNPDFRNSFENG